MSGSQQYSDGPSHSKEVPANELEGAAFSQTNPGPHLEIDSTYSQVLCSILEEAIRELPNLDYVDFDVPEDIDQSEDDIGRAIDRTIERMQLQWRGCRESLLEGKIDLAKAQLLLDQEELLREGLAHGFYTGIKDLHSKIMDQGASAIYPDELVDAVSGALRAMRHFIRMPEAIDGIQEALINDREDPFALEEDLAFQLKECLELAAPHLDIYDDAEEEEAEDEEPESQFDIPQLTAWQDRDRDEEEDDEGQLAVLDTDGLDSLEDTECQDEETLARTLYDHHRQVTEEKVARAIEILDENKLETELSVMISENVDRFRLALLRGASQDLASSTKEGTIVHDMEANLVPELRLIVNRLLSLSETYCFLMGGALDTLDVFVQESRETPK